MALAHELADALRPAKIKVVDVPFHELVADISVAPTWRCRTSRSRRSVRNTWTSQRLPEGAAGDRRASGTEVARRERRARTALGGAERHDAEGSAGTADRTDDEDARVRAPARKARGAGGRTRRTRCCSTCRSRSPTRANRRASTRSPRSCPSEAELGAALPSGSDNTEAVDSAIRAAHPEGADRPAWPHHWLHADYEEGGAEGVPVLRTAE